MLQVLEPLLNKQGPRWGETAEYLQYVQVEWEALETPEMTRLRELSEKMDQLQKTIKAKVK